MSIGEITVRARQRDPRRNPAEPFRYVDVSSVSNSSFRIVQTAEMLGAAAPSRARKAIHVDDILFATVRPTLRRVAIVPPELDEQIASTGFIVLRPERAKLEPRYLYYRLLTREFTQRMGELQRGASYPAVRDTDVLNERILVPPLGEQRKIADVLGLVQRSTDQQERLLALTAELKQALLHQLFTHGLRNEPQKQTELGPIPQSWELPSIGELKLDMGDGNYSTKYPRQEEFLSAGVPFLRANNLIDGRLIWDDMRYISSALHAELRKGHTKKGDVCLVTRGNIGEVAFVTDEFVGANMNAQLVRLNGGDIIDGKFLYFALAHPTTQKQFRSLKTGTALQQLPIGKLKFVRIPIPSIDEQIEIANSLWLVTEKAGVIERRHAALSALFRTLLHELMTAKIHVNDLDLSMLQSQE